MGHDMNKPNTDDFKADHRKVVREWELEQVIGLFPAGGAVLEIGAGAGWQAKCLADRGFKVTAIDIAQSRYHQIQEWPVIDYDGFRIPLEDKSVDVVFSSNVLEHIPHIDQFMIEMRRVLRPGGIAVHVMPTTLWRFITCLTFYLRRLKILLPKKASEKKSATPQGANSAPKLTPLMKLRNGLFPTLHGVRGNVLTEHYYFSQGFWHRTFTEAGWNIIGMQGAGLLYSGYRVCGFLIPIKLRHALAKLFGSSCRIYIAVIK